MKSWVLWTSIAMIVGVIIMIFILWDKMSVSKKIRQIESRNDISLSENIFVTLVCNSYSPVDSFFKQLFLNAACPSRVFVGVFYYENVKYQPSLYHPLERYKRRTKFWSKNWADHIRVYTSNEFKGYNHARAIIETHLFQNEKYLFHLQSCCRVVNEWDETVLNQFHNARMKFQSDQIILSQYCGTECKIPNWPIFNNWDKDTGYPLFKKKDFVKSCNVSYLSPLWCSDMSFSYSSLMRYSGNSSHLVYLEKGYEFYMTIYYFIQGYRILTCSTPIIYMKPHEILHFQNIKQVNDSLRYQTYSNLQSWFFQIKSWMQEYLTLFPISLYEQSISPLSKLGLNEKVSTDEIINKFGSLVEFQRQMVEINGSFQ